MRIFAETGKPDLAVVYMADFGEDRIVEFVEALQPPFKRDERWILMVSTLFGCPVKCLICDAGGSYHGKPDKHQILEQIDYLVEKRFPGREIPCEKFKIQFARMGEPALNPAVLEVLRELPSRYSAPGIMPSISTIAPHGCDSFMDELVDIKNQFYPNGRFQFQFSLHTTDQKERDRLIPVKKWGFEKMVSFGDRYLSENDRKITLNFALASDVEIDKDVLLKYFDPKKYLIKITPINPTYQAIKNNIQSRITEIEALEVKALSSDLIESGYDVIVSIGEMEENMIGSNCGQYVLKHIKDQQKKIDGYAYPIQQNEELKI